MESFLASPTSNSIPEDWYFKGRFDWYYPEVLEGKRRLAYCYDGKGVGADLFLSEGEYGIISCKGEQSPQIEETPVEDHSQIFEIWQIDDFLQFQQGGVFKRNPSFCNIFLTLE